MITKLYFYISTENIYFFAIQYIIHTFIKIENAFEKFYDGSCKVK